MRLTREGVFSETAGFRCCTFSENAPTLHTQREEDGHGRQLPCPSAARSIFGLAYRFLLSSWVDLLRPRSRLWPYLRALYLLRPALSGGPCCPPYLTARAL